MSVRNAKVPSQSWNVATLWTVRSDVSSSTLQPIGSSNITFQCLAGVSVASTVNHVPVHPVVVSPVHPAMYQSQ